MTDSLKALIEACRNGEANYQDLVDRVPYARFLGIELLVQGEELTFILPRNEDNIGNPTLPALHGGAVAGFMEQAAIIFILLEMGEPKVPKTSRSPSPARTSCCPKKTTSGGDRATKVIY